MSAVLRPAALSLSFAFGIISMSVGINALVKSNNRKNFVKHNVPAGVSVDINTNDIFDTGIIVTIVSALLALLSILSLLFSTLRTGTASVKTHRILASVHFFLVTWLFAVLVPFDDFARNRQAQVTASLGGVPLPATAIQQQEQALGFSPIYWSMHFIRLVAIIPWFAILFGALAGALLFRAPSARNGASAVESPQSPVADGKHDVDESAPAVRERERDEKV
ncbi:hypothetical protein EW145_g7938 [Phellinidium pouzarii]|uniref:Uncharacterized protein n=1 Tax=Phellinidium pouzarii TaxID=167371 RepID=A0A4S4KBZ1_9AGAM|nr:hypothetical protein EW145_g7938 [Phellinidium pouzarii]